MTIEDQIKYWRESAEYDLTVADSLFEKGHYAYSLFIGHLVIEKILKAIYVSKIKQIPPRTHNLLFLSKLIGLPLNNEQENFFFRVNSFNIEARYPDEKRDFYKACTSEFAKENLLKIKEIREWLKSQLPY